MISENVKEHIRELTDIISVIEGSGVSLKRQGDSYKGLCPFHDERSPSFTVRESTQSYHCFGCGESGDVFSYLQKKDGYSFVGAVTELGERVNVEVVDSAGNDPDYERKKRYISCVKDAAWFYQQKFINLPYDHPAKVDLQKRNYFEVKDRPTWLEDFGMGYAPDTGNAVTSFLRSRGYSDKEIMDAGLAKMRDNSDDLYDRFRDRLLWSIRNVRGQVIGFSGRILNQEKHPKSPKYLNTPETIMYKKSKILFGLNLAQKQMRMEKRCYVTEGAADVMAVAAVGMTNTVASCGTAFGSEHASIIRRIIDDFDTSSNGEFVFVFDGDEAGIKAASKMFTSIKPSIKDRSYVVSLGEYDPVDYRRIYGDEALIEKLLNPEPITEFMLNRIAKKYDMNEVENRNRFVTEALELLSYIDEPLIYDEYKRKVSLMAGTNLTNVRQKPKNQNYEETNQVKDIDPFAGIVKTKTTNDIISENIISSLFQYPEEAFEVLYGEELDKYIDDPIYQSYLHRGLDKVLQCISEGMSYPRITIGDFENDHLAIELMHKELQIPKERISQYIEEQINKLEKIFKSKAIKNARYKSMTDENNPQEALRAFMAGRGNRQS